jgi:hypothetical protein
MYQPHTDTRRFNHRSFHLFPALFKTEASINYVLKCLVMKYKSLRVKEKWVTWHGNYNKLIMKFRFSYSGAHHTLTDIPERWSCKLQANFAPLMAF